MRSIKDARILVVEDDIAISMLIEDMFYESGFTCFYIAPRVDVAMKILSRKIYDIGVLDINIAGEPVYPVAKKLSRMHIPFFFQTGYGGAGVREPFRDRLCIQKPFGQKELIDNITKILLEEYSFFEK